MNDTTKIYIVLVVCLSVIVSIGMICDTMTSSKECDKCAKIEKIEKNKKESDD